MQDPEIMGSGFDNLPEFQQGGDGVENFTFGHEQVVSLSIFANGVDVIMFVLKEISEKPVQVRAVGVLLQEFLVFFLAVDGDGALDWASASGCAEGYWLWAIWW